MTPASALRRYRRGRRRTQLGLYACAAFPVAFMTMLLAWREFGLSLANASLLGLSLLAVQVALIDRLRREKRVDTASVSRHLDHRFPELEDSSGLIGSRTAGPLQALQRGRVGERLLALRAEGKLAVTPRPGAQWGAVGLLVLGAAGGNLVWLWPELEFRSPAAAVAPRPAPAITAIRVAVTPPDYTGLPASETTTADVRAAEFSRLTWTVETSAPARRVGIVTEAGELVELDSDDGTRWRSAPWPARATTYRVQLDGTPAPVAEQGIVHRVAVVRDAPPAIEVRQPARVSTALDAAEAAPGPVRVALSASDEYGLSDVSGRATLATGSGEQVEFREMPVDLGAATGSDRVSVDTEIDLAALGMVPGSELYLFFEARDNRPGEANVTASSTYVFRWPAAEAAQLSMAEGMALDVPPEYFRSQRQIIIDTEALIAAAPELAGPEFANRAQTLAFDQKALRLRYGQFLGEEDESSIGPMPTGGDADGDRAAAADEHDDGDGHDGGEHYAGDGHDHGDEHFAGDGHDHGNDVAADGSTFGDAAAAIAPYAHFHDRAEQSTLFDPETTDLLRRALSAMWDSEGALRMRRPADALPHQYRALAFIKRVQQRSRIYVARVGFRPTPIDEGRRLTGELDEIVTGPAFVASADGDGDPAVTAAVRALSTSAAQPSADGFRVLRAWLERGLADARASRDGEREDRLQRALQALLDWQSRGDCGDCRVTLLDAVWRYWGETIAVPARRRAVADPFAAARPPVSAR